MGSDASVGTRNAAIAILNLIFVPEDALPSGLPKDRGILLNESVGAAAVRALTEGCVKPTPYDPFCVTEMPTSLWPTGAVFGSQWIPSVLELRQQLVIALASHLQFTLGKDPSADSPLGEFLSQFMQFMMS